MPDLSQADLRGLSVAVIDHAVRDAKRGDPVAAAWFLSRDARLWAVELGFPAGMLGRIAYRMLEVFYYGK